MRLIINDILTDADKEAVEKGVGNTMIEEVFDLSDIGTLRDMLSERDRHFFECLSWLIRNEKIDIKIIAPLSGEGIAHTKCGVFSDGLSKVAFDGSVNFSRTALLENKESLTASCSWDGEIEIAKIKDIESEFAKTFGGNDPTVRYLDASEVRTRITDSFKDKELVELLDDEVKLIEKQKKDKDLPVSVKMALEKAKDKVKKAISKYKTAPGVEVNTDGPHFPYPSGPREYQKIAFENWKANGQKGLFAMATGTGKTITSLNCLYEIYMHSGYYKAIILVPTVTLVDQWEIECKKFGFNNIIKVCSRNKSWKNDIDRLKATEAISSKKGLSYVIIGTYASYGKTDVHQELNEFSKKQVLLIADEAHNMGAPNIQHKLIGIPYLRRIGLSATPERQFDDTGNRNIRKFFGAEDGYTYEYSMEEAINNGVLCEYYYFPHIVRLTDAEMEEYAKISDRLAKMYNFSKETFDKDNDILTMLLIKRKRIIHKASKKMGVFKGILQERIAEKGDLKYTLVYVPEGNFPDTYAADMYDTHDVIKDDPESEHLIDEYTQAIREAGSRITVKQFTSQTSDREQTLKDFANGQLQVLTSMKCLDEGVDVPRSELAIFCASTGNPRQFIQRRGRILRTHKDKEFATIHDLIVIPEVNLESDSYRMERNMVRAELNRVKNFAMLSRNLDYTIQELEEILDYYKLSIF
jgi:superfamily II DNA or RNA helicase